MKDTAWPLGWRLIRSAIGLLAISALAVVTGPAQASRAAGPSLALSPVNASATEAWLVGTVNPNGSAVTSCEFTISRPAASEPSVALPCDANPGSGTSAIAVKAHASKLLPSETYELTLTAVNVDGENRTSRRFTTRNFTDLAAPGRANELISPGGDEKGGVDAGYQIPNAYFGPQISDDGNRLVFPTRGVPFGEPAGVSGIFDGKILATRTDGGWRSKSVSLPLGPPCSNFELAAAHFGDWLSCIGVHGVKPPIFSSDLYRSVQGSASRDLGGVIDRDRPLVNMNLYRLDMRETPWSRDLLTTAPVVDGANNAMTQGFVATATSDLSKVVFLSNRELNEDAPHDPSNLALPAVWEWAEDGTHLVSVLPDGTPTVGTVGQIEGAGSFNAFASFPSKADRAISVDGRRIYFSAPPLGNDRRLYLRRDRAVTVPVSQPRAGCGTCSQGKDTYWTASRDGRKVFFSSTGQLTPDALPGTNLYRWHDNGTIGGKLALITKGGPQGAGLMGVMAASDDGGTAYFISTAQLTPDAPTGTGHKVYMWVDDGTSDGRLRFIAAIANTSATVPHSMWSPRGYGTIAPVSSDGRYMAFLTNTKLTSSAQGAASAARHGYLYDRDDDTLTCVSCVGETPMSAGDHVYFSPQRGTTSLEPQGYQLPKNVTVTEDGTVRLAFTARHALIPGRDTNGTFDAYLWEDGKVHLISTGVSPEPSEFIDMDERGENVVFATRERLSGWDIDNQYDFYTARVGGGLPEPVPAEICRSDEDCRQRSNQAPERLSFRTSQAGDPEQAEADERSPDRMSQCRTFRRRAKASSRRAKTLVRRAKRESGPRAAKLRARAKRARRASRKQHRRAVRCVARAREAR